MSKINIIAAVGDQNLSIGYKKKLPWNLPADMKHFKDITMGHTLLMGKRTLESLPNGPLPKRRNIVLSSVLSEGVVENYYEADSLEDALELASNSEQVFVIGGSSVYAQCLDIADRLYITWVHGEFPGDTFFPQVDFNQWVEVSREEHQPDAKNKHPYTFCVYDRK
jgi:dihydrofolate reductase